jgi:hypothetical protein
MKTITIPVPSIGKNWRTTLAGAAISGAYAAFALAQHGTLSPQELVICFGLAFMGALAKDAAVTGGTIPATPEAEQRVNTPIVIPPVIETK